MQNAIRAHGLRYYNDALLREFLLTFANRLIKLRIILATLPKRGCGSRRAVITLISSSLIALVNGARTMNVIKPKTLQIVSLRVSLIGVMTIGILVV